MILLFLLFCSFFVQPCVNRNMFPCETVPVLVSELPNYITEYLTSGRNISPDGWIERGYSLGHAYSYCNYGERLIHCRKGMKFNAGDDLISCSGGYACIPDGAYTLNVCATLENGKIWCDKQ